MDANNSSLLSLSFSSFDLSSRAFFIYFFICAKLLIHSHHNHLACILRDKGRTRRKNRQIIMMTKGRRGETVYCKRASVTLTDERGGRIKFELEEGWSCRNMLHFTNLLVRNKLNYLAINCLTSSTKKNVCFTSHKRCIHNLKLSSICLLVYVKCLLHQSFCESKRRLE
jgi:hypothetical protein